jgi:hypothetical protein
MKDPAMKLTMAIEASADRDFVKKMIALLAYENGEFYFSENVEISVFDLSAQDLGIGWDRVEVAFDGVGSGLLDLFGKLGPSAESRAVEASDHGYIDRRFGFANVVEILFGTSVKLA